MNYPPPGQSQEPPQQPYAQPAPYIAPLMYAPAPPSNGLAITSMILGIVGLVIGIWSPIPVIGLFSAFFGFLPAAVAVILGHIGLSRSRQLNGTGHGQAIAGFVTGYVTLAVILAVTAFWVIAVAATSVSDPSYY